MSVRIHAIAKETNKTSKEVIEILAERGYDVKSASSTIDNITAQSLIDEFKESSVLPENLESPKGEEKTEVKEKSTDVPFVKTKQDLDREREEKEKAEQAEKDALAASREEKNSQLPEDIEMVPEPVEKTAGAAPSLPPFQECRCTTTSARKTFPNH